MSERHSHEHAIWMRHQSGRVVACDEFMQAAELIGLNDFNNDFRLKARAQERWAYWTAIRRHRARRLTD